MQNLIKNSLRFLHTLLLGMVLYHPVQAQDPIDFQYVYDELGQLVKVIDSQGVVIEYVYDEVGNMLEIKRSTAEGLAIFGFAPEQGPESIRVEIQGQEFSNVPGDNVVSFNGLDALVNSASPTLLYVTVPAAVSTGPVTVLVAGVSVQSVNDFTVFQAPSITSITPSLIPSDVTVFIVLQGINLNEAQFSVQPANQKVKILSTETEFDGSTARLKIVINESVITQEEYVIAATNDAGTSSITPTTSNTLKIVTDTDIDGDGLSLRQEFALGTDPSKSDTDNDGWLDGIEAEFGGNPIVADSGPNQLIISGPAIPIKIFRPANMPIDTDNDGWPDNIETELFVDPNNDSVVPRQVIISRPPVLIQNE